MFSDAGPGGGAGIFNHGYAAMTALYTVRKPIGPRRCSSALRPASLGVPSALNS